MSSQIDDTGLATVKTRLSPGHVCAGGGGDDGGVPAGRPPADATFHHEQEPIAGGGKGSTLSAVHRGDHC